MGGTPTSRWGPFKKGTKTITVHIERTGYGRGKKNPRTTSTVGWTRYNTGNLVGRTRSWRSWRSETHAADFTRRWKRCTLGDRRGRGPGESTHKGEKEKKLAGMDGGPGPSKYQHPARDDGSGSLRLHSKRNGKGKRGQTQSSDGWGRVVGKGKCTLTWLPK